MRSWFQVPISLIAQLLDGLRRWWRDRGRTSWCYCPGCRHDLNGDDASFVQDLEGFVLYKCASCGSTSQWDFTAPAPLLLDFVRDES